ncbi:MAG TPA: Bcr/CflA family efflux MFS transporter [Aquella sp.]|nr:Bcr/CflA family efflux MFS transporter [Aquella sp.]
MNNTTLNLNSKRIQLITWTILLLFPIIGMAVDLVAPSLPAIANDLDSSSAIVQNAISFYLIGYGFGNFIGGILTDALGRRKLLLGSLCGFILVSLCAATIPYIGILLTARLFQGLMLGVLSVVVRAILADILSAEELVGLGIMIGMMWGLGPIIGPVIGGYLQVYFGWQAGFYFFSIIGILGLATAFFIIPETHTDPHPLSLTIVKQNFSELIAHRQFIAFSILMGLNYSLIIIFNTAGPFLIQTKFHYSAIQFGRIAMSLGIVFLIATMISRYLLTKYQAKQLLSTAVFGFLGLAVFSVTAVYFLKNNIEFISIISGIMFFACGSIFPLSMGKGLSLFRHIAGSAIATMYLICTIITSTSAALISLVHMQNNIPLTWTYLCLTLVSALIYWKLIHNTKQL